MDKREDAGEDFSIDFSKVKGWFKKLTSTSGSQKAASETHNSAPSPKKDEFTVDFAKIWGFIVKHKVLLLLLIPIVLSASIRMHSIDLPITDQWARDNIANFITNDIRGTVNAQYPNLPEPNRQEIVREQFNQAFEQGRYVIRGGQFRGQTLDINAEIQRNSQALKQMFQYEANGRVFTYMPDIDPYTYLRYAENWIETGEIADEFRDGIPIDSRQVAPLGKDVDKTYHPQVIGILYKIMKVFSPNITVMHAAGFLPVVLVALAIIPLFYLIYIIGGGTIGALFGTVFFATNSALLGRTIWGHADTDVYNVVFPIAVFALFATLYKAKTWKAKGILLVLTSALIALYSLFWVGWWYIFDFIVAATGLTIVYAAVVEYIKSKDLKAIWKSKHIRELVVILVAFVAITALLVGLIAGNLFILFDVTISGPLGFTKIKAATQRSLWPNVYTTVAELNPASLRDVIGSAGGRFYFYLGIIGALLTLRNKDAKGNRNIKYASLLLIWFFGTIYASLKGIRFTFLLTPALSIAVGVAIGMFYKFMTGKFSKWCKIPKQLTATVLIIALLLMLYIPGTIGQNSFVQRSYRAASHDLPIVNDGWFGALDKIKADSQEDAIITSWWDFGHHFKYFSGRRVTFDGASQNQPMAHWVGKLFRTSDELQAVGILRMLDCGSRSVFDELFKETESFHDSIRIVNDIIVMPRQQAEAYLQNEGFSEASIENYLGRTHCQPPEAYVIASGDMIGKSGVWSHFGGWDFARAHAWSLSRDTERSEAIDILTTEAKVSEESAAQLYDEALGILSEQEGNTWISPWPSYGSNLIGCNKREDLVQCGNIFYNETSQRIWTTGPQGETTPQSFVTISGNDFIYQQFNDSQVPVSVVLVPRGDNYQAVLSSPELAPSIFTRLYFLEGNLLKYMDPFSREQGLGGQLIYTYKINWDRYLVDIGEVEAPVETEETTEETEDIVEASEGETVEEAEEPTEDTSEVSETEESTSETPETEGTVASE